MVEVYSSLEGFPTPEEQPRYYELLTNIGRFTEKKDARVLVALTPGNELVGGIVYFGDMAEYGSGGTATAEKNASGIRLLGIAPKFQGLGAGKALTLACVQSAREKGHAQVILHTTQAMQVAWQMYERFGLIALAGPFTNLLLSFVFTGIYYFLVVDFWWYHIVMSMLISLNIGFAIFNILPLPPLDGFHLVTSLLVKKNLKVVDFLQRYGFIILIVLLLSGVLTSALGIVSGALLKLYGKFFSLFI